jgi:type IV secretory pathway component VirB8
MANEFSKWDKPNTSKPAAKQPLEVKWRASHARNVREKRTGENPYHAEAERDRLIFRWVMFLVVVTALVVYMLFFMVPAT